MFLSGLWNFCGLRNFSQRIKYFFHFLKKLGAWKHGHNIVGGVNYKYNEVSCQYVPYNPNEEQDTYSKQLIEKRDYYRKRTKYFFKSIFPYFVAITSMCFNIVQCVAK